MDRSIQGAGASGKAAAAELISPPCWNRRSNAAPGIRCHMPASSRFPSLAAAALVIEAAVGYPQALYREIGHPVTWIGALIAALETRLNRGGAAPPPARRARGARRRCSRRRRLPALVLQDAARRLAARLPASGGAGGEPAGAAQPLRACAAPSPTRSTPRGSKAGRRAVAKIVGRDPAGARRAPASRARRSRASPRISPTAIVAPLFWLALVGLPGGGGLQGRQHRQFHDRPPQRALRAISAGRRRGSTISSTCRPRGWPRCGSRWRRGATARAARSGARCAATPARHRSPNAGWPEAAMAGALGLKLAGPRVYGGVLVEDAYMGDGRREAGARRHPRGAAALRARLRDPVRGAARGGHVDRGLKRRSRFHNARLINYNIHESQVMTSRRSTGPHEPQLAQAFRKAGQKVALAGEGGAGLLGGAPASSGGPVRGGLRRL